MSAPARAWHWLARLFADWWWSVDRVLFFAFCATMAIGLVLSLATSPAASASNHFSNPFHYFARQSLFAASGLVLMVGVSLADPLHARRFANLVLIGALVVMVFIIFAGHEAKGAQRWVRLGGFTLQPSEFLKPGLIVTIAWLFSRARSARSPTLLAGFAIYLVSVGLLMKQPDLGQSILITASFGVVFFLAGLSWLWIVGLGVFSLGSIYAAYVFFPYVTARFQHFLAPAVDGTSQTGRALAALASGGLFGRGPGEGVIKMLLPEAHTDYIFSVTVEEYGALAGIVIIGLFALMVARGFASGLRLTDRESQLAVIGLTSLIGFQAAINLAVNLHLSPPEGMTLPFLSYGGSSMLAMCLTAGLLLAFTRRRPGAFA